MILKQRAQPSHDFEADADEALRAARNMPPRPDHLEASKVAARLRNAADVYDMIFAKRPPNASVAVEGASTGIPVAGTLIKNLPK